MTDLTKLSAFQPETKSRSRDESVTQDAAMVAIMRPDLNGEAIAAFLRSAGHTDAKGAYCGVVANNVRALWRQLSSGNPVEVNGKRFALREVPAAEVRKTA